MKHSPGRHSSPHPFALRADAVRSAPWRALPRHGVFLKVRFMGHVLRYTDTILKEQKGAYEMEYTMKWVRGHVEVYDRAGRFLFSADSEAEAYHELEDAAA